MSYTGNLKRRQIALYGNIFLIMIYKIKTLLLNLFTKITDYSFIKVF